MCSDVSYHSTSRKLEAEIKRNIELMWLTQGLIPSYKTIANFRKEE
jgi:transposase